MPFQVASTGGAGAFPWLSAATAVLLAGAAVMLGVLVVMLRRAPDPIINLRLLTNRTYLIAIILGILVGVALANVQVYTWIFNFTRGPRSLLDSNPFPYPEQVAAALAFAVGAVVAGQFMGRTGRCKRPILALLLIGTVGALLLARLNSQTGAVELALSMAITGLGLGGLSALLIAVVQNAFPHRTLGEVTASLSFFGFLGAILVGPLIAWLARVSYTETVERSSADPRELMNLHIALLDALGVVFVVTAVLLAAGFVLALWLPETRGRPVSVANTPAESNSPTVRDVPIVAERRRAREAQPRPPTDPAVDDARGTPPSTGGP